MVAPARIAPARLSPRIAPSNDPAYGDMSRGQLIDRIRSFNSTATSEYLAAFDERSLRLYLEHLNAASAPRGRASVWERPGDTPAVSSYEPAD